MRMTGEIFNKSENIKSIIIKWWIINTCVMREISISEIFREFFKNWDGYPEYYP